MGKEFKVIRAKFKVANDVTVEQIEDNLKTIDGYEKLSMGMSGTILEVTVEGETYTKVKPEPDPEPKS